MPARLQAKQRVNVSKLVAPNFSGGYLLSYENDNIESGSLKGVAERLVLVPGFVCDRSDYEKDDLESGQTSVGNWQAAQAALPCHSPQGAPASSAISLRCAPPCPAAAGDVTFGPITGWDHPFLVK